MRRSLLLSLLAGFLASACDTEIPCDQPFMGNDTAPQKRQASPPQQLPSYKNWLPAQGGCWSDNQDHVRALEWGAQGLDGNQMTPQACLDACEAQGFFIAGVEYSRECFCGNTIIGNNRPTSASRCSMPCAGDATYQCGGPDALNVYVRDNYPFTVGPASYLPGYNGYNLAQCWVDNSHPRILPNDPAVRPNPQAMTVQKCIDACSASGYSSAGLEYGRECYCSNSPGPYGQSAPIDQCDMPCLGDASLVCGGRNRMLIYNKPTEVTHRGILQITNSNNGQIIGYVGAVTNANRQYFHTPNEANALIVKVTLPGGATSGTQLPLSTENSNTGFDLIGLIQGRDDTNSAIAPGSFHYLYAGGVTSAGAGVTPQLLPNSYNAALGASRTSESHVWNIDFTTGATSVQWINPDGSSPTTYMFTQSTVLYFGGDPAAFLSRYPAPVTPFTLKFLPRP